MTTAEFWHMLATMDDNEFKQFSATIGFSPKPFPPELMSNFRVRVVDSLLDNDRVGEQRGAIHGT